MKNAPSFLGYSQLSAEITAGAIDHREQIDLSTEHAVPGPEAPIWDNLLAPNQWPSASVIPNFRRVYADYMARMGAISIQFTSLIAEAIELPADAFNRYFDADQQQLVPLSLLSLPPFWQSLRAINCLDGNPSPALATSYMLPKP